MVHAHSGAHPGRPPPRGRHWPAECREKHPLQPADSEVFTSPAPTHNDIIGDAPSFDAHARREPEEKTSTHNTPLLEHKNARATKAIEALKSFDAKSVTINLVTNFVPFFQKSTISLAKEQPSVHETAVIIRDQLLYWHFFKGFSLSCNFHHFWTPAPSSFAGLVFTYLLFWVGTF